MEDAYCDLGKETQEAVQSLGYSTMDQGFSEVWQRMRNRSEPGYMPADCLRNLLVSMTSSLDNLVMVFLPIAMVIFSFGPIFTQIFVPAPLRTQALEKELSDLVGAVRSRTGVDQKIEDSKRAVKYDTEHFRERWEASWGLLRALAVSKGVTAGIIKDPGAQSDKTLLKDWELKNLVNQTALEMLVAESRMESIRNTGLVGIETLERKNRVAEARMESVRNTDLLETLALENLVNQTAQEMLVAEARRESSRNTDLGEIETRELKNPIDQTALETLAAEARRESSRNTDPAEIETRELKNPIDQTALETLAAEARRESSRSTDPAEIETLELKNLVNQTALEMLVAEARMESIRSTGLVRIETLERKNLINQTALEIHVAEARMGPTRSTDPIETLELENLVN